MNNFQTILIAIFLALLVFGVLVFSGIIDIGRKEKGTLQGKVVVWGTFGGSEIREIFEEIKQSNTDLSISYVKKEVSEYQDELIKAFANGSGPDLFFITPNMIMANDNFINKMSYQSYPEKNFRDSFIDGADIFLGKDGVIAFPTVVDPIVMYYNKNILANEGLVTPPSVWSDLFSLNSSLTKRENNGVINQSMIALGQYGNINQVKNILSTILIQNGNPIVSRVGENYEVSLVGTSGLTSNTTAQEAIKFFTEFSNPSNTAYSWNRSLPNSFDMFVSGKLAFYIGMASDLFKIQKANPNLSFDVTQIPQIKSSNNKRTFGEIYGLAISKRTKNMSSSMGVATTLLSSDYALKLATALSLPPASRTLLASRPEDPYLFTFYNSAVISRSWFDPDREETNSIFYQMIEDILSNKYTIDGALGRAQGQIELLIK